MRVLVFRGVVFIDDAGKPTRPPMREMPPPFSSGCVGIYGHFHIGRRVICLYINRPSAPSVQSGGSLGWSFLPITLYVAAVNSGIFDISEKPPSLARLYSFITPFMFGACVGVATWVVEDGVRNSLARLYSLARPFSFVFRPLGRV